MIPTAKPPYHPLETVRESKKDSSRSVGLTDKQIKYMVDRFLRWRLPESFNPDGGIRYKPYPLDVEKGLGPIGTNLLDAKQAEIMIRTITFGLPDD